MRVEILEPLCEFMDAQEVADMAFESIEKSLDELRSKGIETEMPKIVILNDIEYKRSHKTKED